MCRCNRHKMRASSKMKNPACSKPEVQAWGGWNAGSPQNLCRGWAKTSKYRQTAEKEEGITRCSIATVHYENIIRTTQSPCCGRGKWNPQTPSLGYWTALQAAAKCRIKRRICIVAYVYVYGYDCNERAERTCLVHDARITIDIK